MSRKSRHGRRQPAVQPRPARPAPQLVALPVRDGTTGRTVALSDGTAPAMSLSAYQLQSARIPPSGNAYPAMPTISPDKPLLTSLGATGTAIFSGIITSEEYNSDFYWKDAIQIYEMMIRNDAQIFAMTQLLELPIRRATWSIEPASDQPRDKEIASFVESCLFHDMRYTTTEKRTLTQKWDDILRHILMMLRYGFMAFEKCFRIEDGWVKWARWTPLLPRTVWRWWVGEDNELVGIQQWTFKDYTYQFVDIPADKMLLFVHRQEGNNYEGVSVLRSAYKHWYYKDNYYKIEAVDIERNAAEIPAVYLPDNFTDLDVANAKTLMANMRVNDQMGVTMPPGWKIEYIRTYGRNTATVQPSIQHHDIMIARNILGQFLNLGSSETGSYALAQEQTATFLAALQAECEYVEDVINSDAIPELVNYNYQGVEVYPRLKASKVLAQDFDAIADALNKLTSAPSGPLIHGDPELEDFLRNELGLPKAPQSPVNATNPTAPSTPDRPETDAANNATGDGDHATQQSQDAQPTPQQEATSQAIANGAPNANTASGQVQESGTAAREALTVEARLLREALDAAYRQDAVERGLQFSGHQPGYTQNRGPGGKWGPGDGGANGGGSGGVHAPHGLQAEHGVHAHGGQGSTGSGGGSAGKAKSGEGKSSGGPKGGTAHAPIDAHWEGKATSGNWNDQYKGMTLAMDAHGGKVEVKATDKHGGVSLHVVEPDHEYGGYKVTNKVTGEVEHGLTAKGVNEHFKYNSGKFGYPTSATGFKMTKGQFITKEMLPEPGAKPNAAQKALNKQHEFEAHADEAWKSSTANGKSPYIYNTYTGGAAEHIAANGELVRVTHSADGKYKIERFKADPNATVSLAHYYYGKATYGAGHEHFPQASPWQATPYSTKTYVKAETVKANLEKMGVHNKFDPKTLAASTALHNQPAPGSLTNVTPGFHLPGGVTPHSTTGFNMTMQHNMSVGHLSDVELHGVGHATLKYGPGHSLDITDYGKSGIEIRYTKAGKVEKFEHLDPAQAHAKLNDLHITDGESHQFVEMVHHDAGRYAGKPLSEYTAEQQARIAAVSARKAKLDAKFGTYSQNAAAEKMKAIYKEYPELRAALSSHLSGGSHLQTSSIKSKNTSSKYTPTEKLARAEKAYKRMSEVTAWSLLHSSRITREGTIRLFHGTNGTSSPAKWKERLASTDERRGTPFTDRWSVARSFAGHGQHGPMIVSAQVPFEAVATWHGIRGDSMYGHEHEYTVGTGQMNDYDLLKIA